MNVLFVDVTSAAPKVCIGLEVVPWKTLFAIVTLCSPSAPSSQFWSGSISKFWLSVFRKRVPVIDPPELLNRPRLDAEPEKLQPEMVLSIAEYSSLFTKSGGVNDGGKESTSVTLYSCAVANGLSPAWHAEHGVDFATALALL